MSSGLRKGSGINKEGSKKVQKKKRKKERGDRRKQFMEKVEKHVQCSYKVTWHKHSMCGSSKDNNKANISTHHLAQKTVNSLS